MDPRKEEAEEEEAVEALLALAAGPHQEEGEIPEDPAETRQAELRELELQAILMLRSWECSREYSRETEPRPTTSSRKYETTSDSTMVYHNTSWHGPRSDWSSHASKGHKSRNGHAT